jgi:hypothetical protein
MPIQSLGGTPAFRRPDPVVPVSNGKGLSPWSVFRATYAKFAGTVISPEVTDGFITNPAAVLFTSDVPAIITVSALLANATTISTVANNDLSAAGILVTTLGGSTSVTIPAYGQVAQGYAGAAKDVLCSGFPISGVFLAGAAGLSFFVDCVANGSVINCPIGRSGVGTGSSATAEGLGASPIILKSTDYTNAIKANNNLIVDSLGYSYIVVGLYLAP